MGGSLFASRGGGIDDVVSVTDPLDAIQNSNTPPPPQTNKQQARNTQSLNVNEWPLFANPAIDRALPLEARREVVQVREFKQKIDRLVG